MNKTITASLAGMVFHIDENGYAVLQQYLENIRARLGNDEDAREIMTDIESRIAELFYERTQDRKESVSANDVNDVIKIMGSPEDYVDIEENDYTEQKTSESTSTARKLYRDEDNKMLGGVCAGLANYFGMEVTWLRIILLVMVMFFGTGIFLYLALWILIPVARTTAEKLEMKGEQVNAKTIKDHLKGFAKEVEKLDSKQNRDRFNRAGKQLFQSISRVLGVISVITASMLLITLVYWLVTKDFFISVTNTGVHGIDMQEFMQITLTPLQQGLITIGLVAFLLGPIIGLYTFGVRVFLKNFKSIKIIAISSTALWIIGSILLTVGGISIARDRSSSHTLKQKYELNSDADIVYIDVAEDRYFSNSYTNTDDYFFELMSLEDDRVVAGWPKVDIRAADGEEFELWVYKTSHGKTQGEAIDNASNTFYPVTIKGNKVIVSPYFMFDLKARYKGQDVNVILKVPNGKQVSLSEGMARVIGSIDNEFEADNKKLVGRTWTMSNNQLTITP